MTTPDPSDRRAGSESSSESEELPEGEYVVESVENRRVHKGGKGKPPVVEYLVKWKNYPRSDNTWEKEDQLKEFIPAMLKEFEARRDGEVKDTSDPVPRTPAKKLLVTSSKEKQGLESSDQFEVESLVGRRTQQRKGKHPNKTCIEYLIKWKDWPESDNTWEEQANLSCYELLENFDKKHGPAILGHDILPKQKTPQSVRKTPSKQKRVPASVSTDSSNSSRDGHQAEHRSRRVESPSSEEMAEPYPFGRRGRSVKGERPQKTPNAKTKLANRARSVRKFKMSPEDVDRTKSPGVRDSVEMAVVRGRKRAISPGADKPASAFPPRRQRKETISPQGVEFFKRSPSPEPPDSKSSAEIRVLVMDEHSPKILRVKEFEIKPKQKLEWAALQYDRRKDVIKDEQVKIIGLVRGHREDFYLCIQGIAPDLFFGLPPNFVRREYPKSLRLLERYAVDGDRSVKNRDDRDGKQRR